MLDYALKASRLVEGKSRADFDGDEVVQLALAHSLQVIGEAARRVSDEFRRQHSLVPWRAIVGMRHKVVHDYMNVDPDIVWETVVNELPGLIGHLEDCLQE